MSTVGEKVSSLAGKAADVVFNPASAAQVVGRDAIAMLIDRAMAVDASDSLISFTQAARVEPLVLVDTDALYVEELYDVLQSLQSIFAGYYLQAIQLDSAIGNVKVMETLGKFNPNGNPTGGAMNLVGQAMKTGMHAGEVHRAGQGVGMGSLNPSHALATAGGVSRVVQHTFAAESYRDALPDFNMIDDVALEANEHGRTGRKLESAHDADHDYKAWKHSREKIRAQQQDEDRDIKLGMLQEQANQRARQEDERKRQQSWQNERQVQQDQDRETDRAMNFMRQQNQEDRQRAQDQLAANERAAAAAKAHEEAGRVSVHLGDDSLRDVKEVSNLSVGKLLEVEIKNNGQTFQIPVAIRLIVNTIPSAQLAHILSLSHNVIKSAKERFHAWKAGRLSFVKDLIFCRDLVDEHRRSLMKSSDSVYHNVVKREKQSLAAALIGGVPSVAAASNMVVTTTNTIEEIEVTMPGKFSDFHARQKIFEETSLMIVAVIDKEWNRVTFYHRGLPDPTEVSFRDIKASSKGSGPDVSDILKAYTLGNAPRL
jgi:hypothetical protein